MVCKQHQVEWVLVCVPTWGQHFPKLALVMFLTLLGDSKFITTRYSRVYTVPKKHNSWLFFISYVLMHPAKLLYHKLNLKKKKVSSSEMSLIFTTYKILLWIRKFLRNVGTQQRVRTLWRTSYFSFIVFLLLQTKLYDMYICLSM
jgi:hypothetical protein